MGANAMSRPLSALALLAVLTSCTGENGPTGLSLDIHEVSRSDLRIFARETGEIQAQTNTRVTSQLEGMSTLIYLIAEGSIVEEGDKLAELDVSEIEDRRATQAITVAKGEAALDQALVNFDIMERQLEASAETAASRKVIAQMRLDKFLGMAIDTPQPVGGGSNAGTNGQMVDSLRGLLESASQEDGANEINYSDLINDVMEILGGEQSLALGMGDMANQVLQQIESIRRARAQLEIDKDTYTHSESLADKEFITRNELERDKLTYESQQSQVMLSWNNLALLIKFSLKENLISLGQEVKNAALDLESVKATNDATRVREEANLRSSEQEYELATDRLENWDRQIRNGIILAPTPGLVVYHREGGGMGRPREPIEEGASVRQRQVLIDLPDVLTMVAELKVHEAQVNKVAIGQPATIEIEAFPEQAFTGRVSWVAALPDSGQMFMNNDLKVYRTTVTLDGENDGGVLRPGMTTTVEIHIGVVRAVLNIPMSALERQGNVHYVWKFEDNGVVAVRVQVGTNNTTYVEIIDGLEEGDRIYLAPPEGAETPDFEQPEEVPIPSGETLVGGVAPADAEMSRGERGATGGDRGMGGMAGAMGGGMEVMQQLRDYLAEELPQYRDQLADDRGWFTLFQDTAFQRAMEGALNSAPPALRSQFQNIQSMMSGGMGRGRGRGRRGGR